MAQNSKLWQTGSTGDGTAPVTQDDWNILFRYLFNNDPATMGVIPGILNELAVSGASSPLSVDTGAANVYGFTYWNSAAVSLAVSTPGVGVTGGHIVLRVDWTAQTVRLVAVRNTAGVAAIPALTQVAGTTWEIRLASFTITTGGVITLTDTREFLRFNTALVHRRQGGNATDWYQSGTTTYRPSDTVLQTGSITWTGGAAASGTVSVTFPTPFTAIPLMFPMAAVAGANVHASPVPIADGTGYTIHWKTIDGTNITSVVIYWWAIGPI